MSLQIYSTTEKMGAAAAAYAADGLRQAIAERGVANLILATGASQFSMLKELIKAPGIDWSKVTLFHLDEYVGLPITHPASFRKYMTERFIQQLPVPLKAANLVPGDAENLEEAIDELGKVLLQHPIDVACIGIGENGHIAFNDPPADFDTEKPYLVVNLDDVCRNQQLGEGWFPTLEDVPKRAVSMSVRQILKSRRIVNTVPDARKAYAMKITIEGELCPQHPASVIRIHPDCITFCDLPAAEQLSQLTKDTCFVD